MTSPPPMIAVTVATMNRTPTTRAVARCPTPSTEVRPVLLSVDVAMSILSHLVVPWSGSAEASRRLIETRVTPRSRILRSSPCNADWSATLPVSRVSPLSSQVIASPSNQSDHRGPSCPRSLIW